MGEIPKQLLAISEYVENKQMTSIYFVITHSIPDTVMIHTDTHTHNHTHTDTHTHSYREIHTDTYRQTDTYTPQEVHSYSPT